MEVYLTIIIHTYPSCFFCKQRILIIIMISYFRAKDRLTIQEREREEAKARQLEKEAARAAEERRRQTLRMVEDEVCTLMPISQKKL